MPTVNRKSLLIMAVCFITAITAFFGYRYSARPAIFYWKKEACQSYRFSFESFFHIPRNAIPGQSTIIRGSAEMRGMLHMRVFSIENNKITVGFQFSPLVFYSRGKRDSSREGLFSRPFYVAFSPDGRMTGFNFSNEIALQDETIIKNIIKNLQIVINNKLGSSWHTEEKDLHGQYTSLYSYNNGVIKKTKNHYNTFKCFNNVACRSIDIKKSSILAKYNSNTSWLSSLKAEELTVFYASEKNQRKAVLKYSSSTEIMHVPHISKKHIPRISLWDNTISPEKDIAIWQDAPKNRLSSADRNLLAKLESLYGTIDFNTFARVTLKKYPAFSFKAVDEFLHFFKLHPEDVLKMPDLLTGKSIDKKQHKILLMTLLSQQEPAAQQALVKIMRGAQYPAQERIQAALFLGAIKHPDQAMIKSLWLAYADRDEDIHTKRKVSNAAVLSLGIIARRLSRSALAEFKQTGKTITDRIAAELRAVKHTNKRCTLLRAAANTGKKQFVAVLQENLESDLSVVRSVAASALAQYNGKPINEILTNQLAIDKNENVRITIIQAMKLKTIDDDSIKTVCRHMLREENAFVRSKLYGLLIKHRTRPGVRETFLKMEQRENDFKNKNIIYRALNTQK